MSTERENIKDVLGIRSTATPCWRSGRTFGLAAFLIIAVLVGYAFLISGNTSQKVQHKTDIVTRGGLTITVTATGTVEPTN